MKKANNNLYKKLALVLSLVTIIVWSIFGTGASLAWFSDKSTEINNIFHFADFNLEVSHRISDGSWENVDSQTKVFDDTAIFEPGYLQVVYLKIENKGDCDFTFDTAVSVTGYTLATNIYGQSFNLQDYLKFGIVVFGSEQEMKNTLNTREMARNIANCDLNRYFESPQINNTLAAGNIAYVAVVVCLPTKIDNIANYQGATPPTVDLGLIIKAEQIKE